MKLSQQIMAYSLLLTACYLLFSSMVLAQQPEPTRELTPQALQLPEVVIIGIDRSKIQRIIPKIVPQTLLPVITQSSRDLSDMAVKEGDRLLNTIARQAEDHYIRATGLDPTNSMAYLRLGDLYYALSRYSQAAETYQNALNIAPNLLEAHYKLGILYESHLQNREQAIEHYRLYLQLGGPDTRVRIWLRNVERS